MRAHLLFVAGLLMVLVAVIAGSPEARATLEDAEALGNAICEAFIWQGMGDDVYDEMARILRENGAERGQDVRIIEGAIETHCPWIRRG